MAADDAVSLVASDTELDYPHASRVLATPSTVASSLHEINKLYSSEERVVTPLSDFMADTINVMGRQHMESAPLEALLDRLLPANVDLQLKQVNEEIYNHQWGQMSNARGMPKKEMVVLVLCLLRNGYNEEKVMLAGSNLEVVDKFCYLGDMLDACWWWRRIKHWHKSKKWVQKVQRTPTTANHQGNFVEN